MATVFLLGPGMWERGTPGPQTPMQTRRRMAGLLKQGGHKVIFMEDDPDIPGEDMVQKFKKLLNRTDVVVIYWPPGARMQTTYDEMLLLRVLSEHQKPPPVWVLHHTSVASIEGDRFEIKEAGGRSRYLTAVVKLGCHPVEWEDEIELIGKTRLLAAEL